MQLHTVLPGDTLTSIAARYGVSVESIVLNNELNVNAPLVVGQVLVILFPEVVHAVSAADTLTSIAARYGITVKELYRNNFRLGGRDIIYPGETLVISYRGEKQGEIEVSAYAYPEIGDALLYKTLPYLTYLAPFTYGIRQNGGLVDLNDARLISASRSRDVAPLMHLSTLTEAGTFSNDLASLVLNDIALQNTLIANVLSTIKAKNYAGLDIDFEFIYPEEAALYAAFIQNATLKLNAEGYPVYAALAPKTSATQRGLFYEGHDYSAVGAAANAVLLMTYEWGYTYGPPLAVAPLPNVRRVLEYALTEIPPEKILLGIPNYGYDWTLPYVQGTSRATSISSQQALSIAARYGAEIIFDENAQSPFFNYVDENGRQHEVWFEDARSIEAKLNLVSEFNLRGVGYWNAMREFPQNWLVLNSMFNIKSIF